MNSLYPLLNSKGKVSVAPSILAADFSKLDREIMDVEKGGADFLHVDVMDGHFVENITFGPVIVKAVAKLAGIPLLTHLMISDPAKYVSEFIEAGSDLVSFHYEAVSSGHQDIIEKIHGIGSGAGLAVNPDTPLDSVRHLLGSIELLLIMSVYPGFGGRGFIEDVLGKIREAAYLKKENGFDYVIEVDGGIKPLNAVKIRDSGAQILVAGTAIFGSSDYAETISMIRG